MEKKAICIGTGLVALDVIINSNQAKQNMNLVAGGSCGNVLSILSFLNWKTYPIARLKINKATEILKQDLSKWEVDTTLISESIDGSTPIIIERVKKDKNGNSIHRFEFKNPETKMWLPSYKPVLSSEVDNIYKKSQYPNVFYFDRVNRASIELAKQYKNNGALVYFEPSSIGKKDHFEECLNIADILKYSKDRIKDYSDIYISQRVPLEIETLGEEGLRYRYSHNLKANNWKTIPSYKILNIVDAAGAGDWLSAGLVQKLGRCGLKGFKNTKTNEIHGALKYGQALSVLNCFFIGARGLMYNLSKEEIEVLVNKIQINSFDTKCISRKKNWNSEKNIKIKSLY
jgi:fructokinase